MKKGETKLTDQLTEKFCRLISNCSPFRTACQSLGIHENTARNWIRWGEDERDPETDQVVKAAKPKFAEFRRRYMEAQAIAEMLLVKQVRDQGGWKGAAWLLSRRFGDTWREQKQLELTGAGGQPLQTSAPAIINFVVSGDQSQKEPWTFVEPDERAG